MTTRRFCFQSAPWRNGIGATPHRLACCLSLLLAWGCSDDEGASNTDVDAGDDAAVVNETSPEAGTTSSSAPSATSASTFTSNLDTSSTTAAETSEPPTTETQDSTSEETTPPGAPDSGVDTSSSAASESSSDEATETPLPARCSDLPAAPLAFETIHGFTSSEDFVFDELGNYVGVDDNNNLVRIPRDGKPQLWLPAIGATAGMGILPDGSVVICDVSSGSLKRVYPNGILTTVLAGLEYPNGLDIGPDGYVYVAENNAGRVRRVNPDSGEFSMVAIGLTGPNGVAFSNDPGVLYVGSFEGSGVYRVEIPAPGELGHASVFSRPNGSTLPEPTLACPEQEVGQACTMPNGSSGECQAVANVVDCFRVDPCPTQADGTSCNFMGQGICKDNECKPACDGLSAWDSCALPFGWGAPSGVCAPQSDGSLECRERQPCDLRSSGDACESYGQDGVCTASPWDGELYCRTPQPCDGLASGDACVGNGQTGTCLVETDESLYCQTPSACEGKADGDVCIAWAGVEGQCVTYGDGTFREVYCEPTPCKGLQIGDRCTEPYSSETGTCREFYDGMVYCLPSNPCDGLEENDACLSGEEPGVCLDYWETDELECVPAPCEDAQAGDDCPASAYRWGVCVEGRSGLTCDTVEPCEGAEVGDSCSLNFWDTGKCALGEDGLYCRPQPCEFAEAGDQCYTDSGSGQCVVTTEGLECKLPCDDLQEGDRCETDIGTGTCVVQFWTSDLICDLPEPCEGRNAGDACTDEFGTGECVWTSYGAEPGYPVVPPVSPNPVIVPVPVSPPPNADPIITAYDAGVDVDAGWSPELILTCRPSRDCTGKPDGEACSTEDGYFGQCLLERCRAQASPGGIDGLGVDACGNVYATEYVVGNVWRIAPDGKTELLTVLPSYWIPNIKWGRGVGGFERDVMYIADRNEGRLFGLSVGAPGVTEYYDLAATERNSNP